MVDDFENIQINKKQVKPRVGVVGEILIKYHPFGNNYVIDVLENEGAEVVMPDFMGFVKYMATHSITNNKLLKKDKIASKICKLAINLIDGFEKDAKQALAKSKKDIYHHVIYGSLKKKYKMYYLLEIKQVKDGF